MKTPALLSALAIVLAISSCQDSEREKSLAYADAVNKIDTNKVKQLTEGIPAIDSCYYLIDTTTALVSKAIKKEMPQAKVNAIVNPMMKRYFAFYKSLSPADTLFIYNYRIKKLNELVDLQVEADKGR